jgi:hypothetical protein
MCLPPLVPQITRQIAGSIEVDRLADGFAAFRTYCDDQAIPEHRWLRLHCDLERWEFEELDDFLAEMRRSDGRAELVEEHHDCAFRLELDGVGSALTIRLPSTMAIDDVLAILGIDRRSVTSPPAGLKVFIGHGRDLQWRVLADHLRSRHDFFVETYETVAEVGQPALDVLDRLAANVSFAILLHTAEVPGEDGTLHAGPNVIHETGYFQARLGPTRALIVREEHCHPFANVAGLTELRFRAGAVEEVFGEVVAILRRVSDRR